jgi:dTDP-4-dehydrorhamnose reductase
MVTGADGQIGWELGRSLLSLGEVIALDRASCDLSRPEALPAIVREARPDVLVNAAGYTAVDKAEEEEALATLVNGTAVGVLAQAAREAGALFVHYSTDYVFDGAKDGAYEEDDPPLPLGAYGRSKLAGEIAARAAGGDHLILRTSWIYAARGHNFLRTILRLACEREELAIVADQIGAPTWARNVSDATALVIRQAYEERSRGQFASGILHMTASGATSWHGFAQAIIDRVSGLPGMGNLARLRAIPSEDYPLPAVRPKNSLLSGKRLCERFGIALPDWPLALARCMEEPGVADVLSPAGATSA